MGTLFEVLEDVYDGHNVVGTVFVQANNFHFCQGPAEFSAVGEVEYCQGVAAACDSGIYGPSNEHFSRICWGICGWCDLRHPNVEAVLLQMMRSRNFKGVRAFGPLDDAFKKGAQVLQQHGLVLERWHHPSPDYDPHELPKLVSFARECPDVTIVLNHLGGAVGPKLTPDMVSGWKKDLQELAACPNVVCKVGGIQMVFNGWGFEKREKPIDSVELAELVFPWYSYAIECFGPARCMFESNFPVDKDCVSYRTLWNTFKRVAAQMGLSETDKRAVFHDTAVRVYKLT